MSDYNIDHEIEEGLKRSEEMLKKQRISRLITTMIVVVLALLGFAVIGGVAYLMGSRSAIAPTPEKQIVVVIATPIPSVTESIHPSDTSVSITHTPIAKPSVTVQPTKTYLPTSTRTPAFTETVTLSAKCPGGDVSGTWDGSASDKEERLPYSLMLIQSGCNVTGYTLTRNIGPAQVKGKVSDGKFYFSEYGEPGFCYFAGILEINGNEMKGADVNCGEWIFLVKRQ